jgi:lactoylglutathione lyase
MIKNLPLDHIGLAVTDVEKNAQWYQEILGFTVKGKFPGDNHPVYFLTNGTVVYEMYQVDDLAPEVQGKIDHIAYTSSDIEADYDFCVKAGYKIVTKGIEICPTFWANGTRYFKIESPCGEQVEICQNV